MALTHQAEAQEFAVKVQNLLAELNKQNSKKVGLVVRYASNTKSCTAAESLKCTALAQAGDTHT
jgi:hypothetical protein